MAVSLWFSQASEEDITPIGKTRSSIMIPPASAIFFYFATQCYCCSRQPKLVYLEQYLCKFWPEYSPFSNLYPDTA